MNKKQILKELISDFHKKPLRDTKERESNIPLDIEKIVVLTGARRSGKTSLLLNTIKKLLNIIPKENIIYINFEDERLTLESDELDLILQSYLELYPDKDLSSCYFFFDEIQEVDGWEKFVRRCDDSISRHIYITGSNAKLLGSEIATALRGRAYRIEVFPLSFREYLSFLDVELEYNSSTNRAKIINSFEKYLHFGGFPEIVKIDDNEIKRKVLQEYYDVMIFRDILERYNQTNIHAIKYFLKRLIESVKSTISISKIHNEMKTLGFRVGKNSLYEYLEFAEAVYFALVANKYDKSIKRQELADKKGYIIDNGFLSAITHKYSSDYGKKLENLVAIELRRAGCALQFAKNGKECDFIVENNGKQIALQVCADLSSFETLNREIEGAIYGARQAGVDNAIILSMAEEKSIAQDGVSIEVVPAWKFCIEGLRL